MLGDLLPPEDIDAYREFFLVIYGPFASDLPNRLADLRRVRVPLAERHPDAAAVLFGLEFHRWCNDADQRRSSAGGTSITAILVDSAILVCSLLFAVFPGSLASGSSNRCAGKTKDAEVKKFGEGVTH